MADEIGLDPDVVAIGGKELQEVAAEIKQAQAELREFSKATAYSGSTSQKDQLLLAFEQNFRPAEKDCLDFLDLLADTIGGRRSTVDAARKALEDANLAATEIAGGTGRR